MNRSLDRKLCAASRAILLLGFLWMAAEAASFLTTSISTTIGHVAAAP
jgi:hypothetical protein